MEELERLSLSQAEIDTIVTEGVQFLACLEFTLRNGLPEEKLVALRQCVEKIHIDKPVNSARISIRMVLVGSFPVTQECKLAI